MDTSKKCCRRENRNWAERAVKRTAICVLIVCLHIVLAMTMLQNNNKTESLGPTVMEGISEKEAAEGQIQTPKIALLFLTTGPVHNEPVWKAFFKAAGKISPRYEFTTNDGPYVSAVAHQPSNQPEEAINPNRRQLLSLEGRLNRTACANESHNIKKEVRLLMRREDDRDLIASQSLFSVHVHPGVTYEFPEESIFYRRETERRVDTRQAWSTFRIVQAELELLWTALRDKRNKKFILLSDTCIPLYTPEVVYAQLMSEDRSRVQSCDPWNNVDTHRYDSRMDDDRMNQSFWRKSSQWFSLTRSHAELLVRDTQMQAKFEKYCNGYQDGNFCVPDEHYVPTTLAVHGLESETDCMGQMTFTRFVGGAHPVSFQNIPVSPKLIRSLRHQNGVCNVARARETSARLFDGIHTEGGCVFRNTTHSTASDQSWMASYEQLGYDCVLFARKFDASIVEMTLAASLSCSGGALGHWC